MTKHICSWIGCKNRVKQEGACYLHARIERALKMGLCEQSFGKWYGFPVCDDMDIQTSLAWECWVKAWNAARETLSDLARDAAYHNRGSIWLMEGTSDRERYAYDDGHYYGWRDARDKLGPK